MPIIINPETELRCIDLFNETSCELYEAQCIWLKETPEPKPKCRNYGLEPPSGKCKHQKKYETCVNWEACDWDNNTNSCTRPKTIAPSFTPTSAPTQTYNPTSFPTNSPSTAPTMGTTIIITPSPSAAINDLSGTLSIWIILFIIISILASVIMCWYGHKKGQEQVEESCTEIQEPEDDIVEKYTPEVIEDGYTSSEEEEEVPPTTCNNDTRSLESHVGVLENENRTFSILPDPFEEEMVIDVIEPRHTLLSYASDDSSTDSSI